jgi:hypothetical protein
MGFFVAMQHKCLSLVCYFMATSRSPAEQYAAAFIVVLLTWPIGCRFSLRPLIVKQQGGSVPEQL